MAARDTNLASVKIMVTKIDLERLATRSLGLAHGADMVDLVTQWTPRALPEARASTVR